MAVGGSGRRGVQSVTGHAAGSSSVGGDAFFKVSKRLKEIGGTGKGSLRNEMTNAVKKAAKPLVPKVKQAAGSQLPQRGGLAARIAKRTPRVVVATGVKTAGVRIQDKTTDPRMDKQGRIYHPIFGRKGSDVVQIAPGIVGYFSETLENEAPAVRADIADTMVEFVKQAGRGL